MSATARLTMPDLAPAFPGPFPSSPHAEQVGAHLEEWLERFPLLAPSGKRRVLCDIVAHGVARTFPTADPDGLRLTADLFLWLTAFDDVHGEEAAAADPAGLVRRIQPCVHQLGGGAAPLGADPFDAALRDLLARLRDRATAEQYLRVAGCLRDVLFGMVWEAHRPAGDGDGDGSGGAGDGSVGFGAGGSGLREYREVRPHTVFARTLLALAEVVLGYELPAADRDTSAVREPEEAVADLAGVLNDLCSYARESAKGAPASLNLVPLLVRAHGGDLSAGYAAAARLAEERAAAARRGIDALAAAGPAPLARHAAALETIAHSYVWHVDHARYRGAGG
ncbi:hypothetical protein [Kitasatospora sp. NPDC088134]|uniref:terpene synthase family protein n=1 Tax=Kitasatospora sp. NPDC088134 TaxID=3364071 RepID=UPI0038080972